jgi:hypothetical protein
VRGVYRVVWETEEVMPKVLIEANKVVQVTENHGGYLGGSCLACGQMGWLDANGYPWRVRKKVMSNRLIHTKNCVMNKVLTDEGKIK